VAGSVDDKFEEVWRVAASQLPPDQLVVVREAMIFLDTALSGRQRVAYLLHHYMGLAIVDIADVMGCSENNVGTHITRAQTKIDKKYNLAPQNESHELPFRLQGGSKA
jgi:DNA-directed RNA polymerase specialized sigma24 family protein